jgi:hypothetical protein
LSQAETREIIAELKAIIIETLQILDEKEESARNDVITPKAVNNAIIKAHTKSRSCLHGTRPQLKKLRSSKNG